MIAHIWLHIIIALPKQTSKNKIEEKLGIFCDTQRQNKKNGKLTNDKIQKLEELNNWYWINDENRTMETFNKNYSELKQWMNINNKVPNPHSKNITEKNLGLFYHRQRYNKKNGKLTKEKIKILEQIGGWEWEQRDFFDENYNKLKQWVEINKKIPISSSKNELERTLGKFCDRQRNNKKNGKLTQEKITKLEQIDNWYWGNEEIKIFKTFDENYNELKQWVEVNNKIPSNKSKNKIENKLGIFCSNQRQNKRNNRLTQEKIQKLEGLDYWYWIK